MEFRTFDNMERNYTFKDGRFEVRSVQDVEPFLKANAEWRNNESQHQRIGDKDILFARVPMVVVEDLMKKGINLFRKEDVKKGMAIIERDYPYLKTTNLKET